MKITNKTNHEVSFHKFRTQLDITLRPGGVLELEEPADPEHERYYRHIAKEFGLEVDPKVSAKNPEVPGSSTGAEKITSAELLSAGYGDAARLANMNKPLLVPDEQISNVSHTPTHPDERDLYGHPTTVVEQVTPGTHAERITDGTPPGRVVQRPESQIAAKAIEVEVVAPRTVAVVDSSLQDTVAVANPPHVPETVEKSHGAAFLAGSAEPTHEEAIFVPSQYKDSLSDPNLPGDESNEPAPMAPANATTSNEPVVENKPNSPAPETVEIDAVDVPVPTVSQPTEIADPATESENPPPVAPKTVTKKK